jgi:hypothetical protein
MTNLLDLDDDILNIIGDYVKQDNKIRLEKERKSFNPLDYTLNNFQVRQAFYSRYIKKNLL